MVAEKGSNRGCHGGRWPGTRGRQRFGLSPRERGSICPVSRKTTAISETYRQYFPPDSLPAWTCVGVAGLAHDALIETGLVSRR
jgi:hypothetical protein